MGAAANIVRYNFKEECFKQIPTVDQLAVHFSLDGNLLHKESDEARRQLAMDGGEAAPVKDSDSEEEDDAEPKAEAETESRDDTASPTSGGKPARKPANQFNFCERASQTYN